MLKPMDKIEIQKMLEYGFIDIAGNVWLDRMVDTYNQYTRDFNQTQDQTILDRRAVVYKVYAGLIQ